jgi:hypothetical protein
MKLRKILLLASLAFFAYDVSAQTGSILGTWQLIRQSTCLDEVENNDSEEVSALRADMQSRTSASAQTVSFKANATGEESTRILNSKRTANQKKFYYKLNGDMLLILDKKSQTISDSYVIDKLSADSLIMSNRSRPCEVRIFTRISEEL